MPVIQATDNDFEQIIKENNIVIVDFWANWCAPCKSFAPVFEALSEKYADKVKFVKVDVDTNFMLATKYNIQGIPTVMIFREWKPYYTIVGVKPQQEYEKVLESILNPNDKKEMSENTNIINVKGVNEFTQAIENNKDKLIIADFWAPWCGPCRMLAPTLEKLAEEYSDKIVVIKANVDEMENQPLAMQFQVSSIPTIAFIKEWEPTEIAVGALPYEQLKEIIEKKIA
jgi:thioredoxin 1